MTQREIIRATLAAVVGLGVTVSLAGAQQPMVQPVPQPAPKPAPSVEPWEVIETGGGAAQHPVAVQIDEVPPFPRKGPVRDWFHDCMHGIGVGCWSHHNYYGCSSWKSEFTFVFGSCRQFFGEPCLAGPPQPPYPPGYTPPPPSGKAGCPNCQ